MTFQPFACKLLDTLQRTSFYTLEISLFLLMVASFEDVTNDAGLTALVIVVAALNLVVLILYIAFIIRGVRRAMIGWSW